MLHSHSPIEVPINANCNARHLYWRSCPAAFASSRILSRVYRRLRSSIGNFQVLERELCRASSFGRLLAFMWCPADHVRNLPMQASDWVGQPSAQVDRTANRQTVCDQCQTHLKRGRDGVLKLGIGIGMLVVCRRCQYRRAWNMKSPGFDGVGFAHSTKVVHQIECGAIADRERFGIHYEMMASTTLS
jgi:RNase P subunit RPR2